MRRPTRLAVRIMSDTRYLSFVREMMRAMQKGAGETAFPKKALVPCMLALVEAVDNAIFHAHSGKRDKRIGIGISLCDGCIRLEVTDEGRGMGSNRPLRPDGLETHGRGLYIMRSVMSDVKSTTARGVHNLRMTYRYDD
jgi:serine/threonine-protein kinase RsbW